MKHIAFNKPFLTGKELEYINEAVKSGKVSGNGIFTKKCQVWFEKKYNFERCLLTTSCTDALEMAAILIDIQPGDEVILPSYTFVSTANAFVLRGAKLVFADSRKDHPGIDENSIEGLITPQTKAIVPVHYAGVACDMDRIMDIANKYGLFVIEDAAQAIDSFYVKDDTKRPLGGIGHLATFSFHETKNLIAGEGGMLVINDKQFAKRAEIIWEKGTNRSSFFRGEVNKYGWVDIGSSFLPSEIISAFLWAQIQCLDRIQYKRKKIWTRYYSSLEMWGEKQGIEMPKIPDFATNNAHMFYVKCKNIEQRDRLLKYLNSEGINAVFHYISLHSSPFYYQKHDGRKLSQTDTFTDTLVRLPLYYGLDEVDQEMVISKILKFNG